MPVGTRDRTDDRSPGVAGVQEHAAATPAGSDAAEVAGRTHVRPGRASVHGTERRAGSEPPPGGRRDHVDPVRQDWRRARGHARCGGWRCRGGAGPASSRRPVSVALGRRGHCPGTSTPQQEEDQRHRRQQTFGVHRSASPVTGTRGAHARFRAGRSTMARAPAGGGTSMCPKGRGGSRPRCCSASRTGPSAVGRKRTLVVEVAGMAAAESTPRRG